MEIFSPLLAKFTIVSPAKQLTSVSIVQSMVPSPVHGPQPNPWSPALSMVPSPIHGPQSRFWSVLAVITTHHTAHIYLESGSLFRIDRLTEKVQGQFDLMFNNLLSTCEKEALL